MYYVYILQSVKDGNRYIGFTEDFSIQLENNPVKGPAIILPDEVGLQSRCS